MLANARGGEFEVSLFNRSLPFGVMIKIRTPAFGTFLKTRSSNNLIDVFRSPPHDTLPSRLRLSFLSSSRCLAFRLITPVYLISLVIEVSRFINDLKVLPKLWIIMEVVGSVLFELRN